MTKSGKGSGAVCCVIGLACAVGRDSSAKMGEELLGSELRLLAGGHILERDEALLQLVLADEGNEGDVARVGVGHLLLHFGGIGIDLGGNAGGTGGARQFEAASGFGGAETGDGRSEDAVRARPAGRQEHQAFRADAGRIGDR